MRKKLSLLLLISLFFTACAQAEAAIPSPTVTLEATVLPAQDPFNQKLPADTGSCTCSEEAIRVWRDESLKIMDGISRDLVEMSTNLSPDREEIYLTATSNQELRNLVLEQLTPPACLEESHALFLLINMRFQEAIDLAHNDDIAEATATMDLAFEAMIELTIKIEEFDRSQIDCE